MVFPANFSSFSPRLIPDLKSSITRATLSKMGLRIALIIFGTTAISYVHLMSSLEQQTQTQLEKYIVERGQRENILFSLVEENHGLLEQSIRRQLDETYTDQNVEARFDQLLRRSSDGTFRNQPKGFDRSRQPSVLIGKEANLTPELRRRVMIFYDLVGQFGPAWRGRFDNTYITAPENLMVMYWPEVPWADNATKDLYIPAEEYFWIADRQHNPSRRTVCTGLYYEKVARNWIVSCETPVDLGDRLIATLGTDIILNELLDRTLQEKLPGTYNIIFRADGRLIAHPEKMDLIKQREGNFDIQTAGDAHLNQIFQLVKNAPPGVVVVDNQQHQEYLAIAKLDVPGWYFVTVYPKSILTGLALDNARFILIVGLLSLLIEIGALFFVLRQQVAAPLNNLMTATDQIAGGDFNIQLDTDREDELGRLAHSFNAMASEVYAREDRLKQAQIALQATDRLKDEFLANTSHELRTPLNGIIGIAESLMDGAAGQLSHTTLVNLRMIATSGRRLANLVNDILDFAKLKHQNIQLQLKPVTLREIVDIVLNLNQAQAQQKSLLLLNTVGTDLPLVWADENRLQQILYNLVGNSIKFTETGHVEVSATLLEDNQVAITISDTGIGIAEDKLERIFESFEQADGSTARIYGGTGLGLAITKKLVELHGGEMKVTSVIDRGSHFTFTLPISPTSPEIDFTTDNSSPPIYATTVFNSSQSSLQPEFNLDPEPSISGQENTLEDQKLVTAARAALERNYHILIVDDEPVNRQVLVNHLSLSNYHITEATSGPETLILLENGFKPDLILLDVMMPRMTGYEVTRKIRSTWQPNELPIVLLTAKNQVSDLVVGLEAGANDYLTKPVAKDELMARLKTHCTQAAIFSENTRLYLDLQAAELRERERAKQLQHSIEQLQATQLQLVQQEKMASIGQLIAGVAHEINNPIGFVAGNLDFIAKEVNDLIGIVNLYQSTYPQPTPDLVAEMEAIELEYVMADLPELVSSLKIGTERIRVISNSLRTFSRADTNHLVAFDLREGIDSTLVILKYRLKANGRYPDIKIVKDYGSVPPVDCYPSQLNQVFLNLLANAIDALDEAIAGLSYEEALATNRQIVIKTELSSDEQWAIVRFQDSGPGMSEEIHQKIFDYLFTTKAAGKGTGLGLSISHQIIVEKHKGRLSCASTLGKGTEFIVEIPLLNS